MNKELFSYYLIFRKSTFCVLSIGDHKLLAVAVDNYIDIYYNTNDLEHKKNHNSYTNDCRDIV